MLQIKQTINKRNWQSKRDNHASKLSGKLNVHYACDFTDKLTKLHRKRECGLFSQLFILLKWGFFMHLCIQHLWRIIQTTRMFKKSTNSLKSFPDIQSVYDFIEKCAWQTDFCADTFIIICQTVWAIVLKAYINECNGILYSNTG